MDFLGQDDKFYYLDGTDGALKAVSSEQKLSLREDNIASYIQFYFFNVVQEDGEIYPLFDEYPLSDLADQNVHDTHQDLPAGTPQFQVEKEGNAYKITTPLFYSGAIMLGKLDVSADGVVTIETVSPLLGSGIDNPLNDIRT